jgi:hypothetical protein
MTSRFIVAMGAATALSAVLFVGSAIEFLPSAACAAPPVKPHVSFSEDVLPLLKFKCGACHLPGGEGAEKSGFEVTSYETVMKGTKFGAVIIAGDPDASSLMRMLDWGVSPEIRMPHGKKQLSTCDRDLIRTWIFEGAKNN